MLVEPNFYIGSCVFAELSSVLLSVGARRVTHYLDKAFGEKYAASMWFLAELEKRCGSRKAALALRSHVSFVDFLQKWELPLRAHLQLRQQEVTAALGPLLVPPALLTQALSELQIQHAEGTAAALDAAPGGGQSQPSKGTHTSPLPPPPPPKPAPPASIPLPRILQGSGGGGPAVWLQSSAKLQAAVLELLSNPIPALAHRYLQLCLVLFAKYAAWAEAWTSHLSSSLLLDSSSAAPSSPERGGGREGGKKGGERGAELLFLAALAQDAASLSAWLNSTALPLALAALPQPAAPEAPALLSGSLTPIAGTLVDRGSAATSLIVLALAARCSEPLSAVGAIPSQYRMTNRAPPTKASVYVKGATTPLRTALSSTGSLSPLDPDQRADVVDQVAAKAAQRFSELIEEVFANVKKLEQTLKKLKKEAGGGGGLSDGDKVHLQVLLDVEELCKETEDLGAVTETIEPLHNLLEMVRGVCKERNIAAPTAS